MSRQQGLSSYSDVDTSVIEKLYVFTVCLIIAFNPLIIIYQEPLKYMWRK